MQDVWEGGGGQRCAEKVARARCLCRGVRCVRVPNKRKKREGQDVGLEGQEVCGLESNRCHKKVFF